MRAEWQQGVTFLRPLLTVPRADLRACLRRRGLGRLDDLAVTHGDPDHIGGMSAIVRDFRPREVWEGIPVPRSGPLAALRVQAQAAGAAYVLFVLSVL